jgi:hypothetical protein
VAVVAVSVVVTSTVEMVVESGPGTPEPDADPEPDAGPEAVEGFCGATVGVVVSVGAGWPFTRSGVVAFRFARRARVAGTVVGPGVTDGAFVGGLTVAGMAVMVAADPDDPGVCPVGPGVCPDIGVVLIS